jgi:hypothetical protein
MSMTIEFDSSINHELLIVAAINLSLQTMLKISITIDKTKLPACPGVSFYRL